MSWPLSPKNGYAETREGVLNKSACERTTELAVRDASGLPQMTKCDVPELPKNGRVMHICTSFAVATWVGISLQKKIFHSSLWKI